jgi:hypothetical protein
MATQMSAYFGLIGATAMATADARRLTADISRYIVSPSFFSSDLCQVAYGFCTRAICRRVSIRYISGLVHVQTTTKTVT